MAVTKEQLMRQPNQATAFAFVQKVRAEYADAVADRQAQVDKNAKTLKQLSTQAKALSQPATASSGPWLYIGLAAAGLFVVVLLFRRR
jgi:ElaB/YqjD/DUF883 family membrane-anchored ribosome-binding protein